MLTLCSSGWAFGEDPGHPGEAVLAQFIPSAHTYTPRLDDSGGEESWEMFLPGRSLEFRATGGTLSHMWLDMVVAGGCCPGHCQVASGDQSSVEELGKKVKEQLQGRMYL